MNKGLFINLIAAVDENLAIGAEGRLLFHLPEDLKRFKALTLGFPVIMGRKTFESLKAPLIDRINIVISSKPRPQNTDLNQTVIWVSSLNSALQVAKDFSQICFIIGGGEVYTQAISLADKLLITHIHHSLPSADTFFPVIDPKDWQLTSTGETQISSRGFSFHFSEYQKIGS